MSRLVIVANRVPDPRERGATGGGLAVALKDALAKREAMWFGWSGGTAAETPTEPKTFQHGRTTYATIDLGEADYRTFYTGFSNAALWPVLHYRLGIARFDREDWIGYRRVNAAFAAGARAAAAAGRHDLGARFPPLPPGLRAPRARAAGSGSASSCTCPSRRAPSSPACPIAQTCWNRWAPTTRSACRPRTMPRTCAAP
jgi:hypothetical protein